MTRALHDAYWTPRDVARRCTAWLADRYPVVTEVWEPSVGGGAWVEAARWAWEGVTVHRVDIDLAAPGLELDRKPWETAWPGASWLDVAKMLSTRPQRRRLVLGNPPYLDVEAHILASLRAGDVVALLLRETITGGAGRYQRLWRHCPPAWIGKLPDRPRWEGASEHASGDTAGSVFVVWESCSYGSTRWDWIPEPRSGQGWLFGGGS